MPAHTLLHARVHVTGHDPFDIAWIRGNVDEALDKAEQFCLVIGARRPSRWFDGSASRDPVDHNKMFAEADAFDVSVDFTITTYP